MKHSKRPTPTIRPKIFPALSCTSETSFHLSKCRLVLGCNVVVVVVVVVVVAVVVVVVVVVVVAVVVVVVVVAVVVVVVAVVVVVVVAVVVVVVAVVVVVQIKLELFCRFPRASRKHLAHTHKTFIAVCSAGRVVLIALLQGDVTKVWRSTSRDEAEPTKAPKKTRGQQLKRDRSDDHDNTNI